MFNPLFTPQVLDPVDAGRFVGCGKQGHLSVTLLGDWWIPNGELRQPMALDLLSSPQNFRTAEAGNYFAEHSVFKVNTLQLTNYCYSGRGRNELAIIKGST